MGRSGPAAGRKNYLGELKAGSAAVHTTEPHRGLWFQVISGELTVGGEHLAAGDGLAVENAAYCEIAAKTEARFLLSIWS